MRLSKYMYRVSVVLFFLGPSGQFVCTQRWECYSRLLLNTEMAGLPSVDWDGMFPDMPQRLWSSWWSLGCPLPLAGHTSGHLGCSHVCHLRTDRPWEAAEAELAFRLLCKTCDNVTSWTVTFCRAGAMSSVCILYMWHVVATYPVLCHINYRGCDAGSEEAFELKRANPASENIWFFPRFLALGRSLGYFCFAVLSGDIY